jgi:hypothetical protein
MPLSWLWERLRGFGHRPALLTPGGQHSYHELLQAVGHWRELFAARGVREGECVALEGS